MRSTLTSTAIALALALCLMNSNNLLADPVAGSPSTVVARQGTATVTLEDLDLFAQRIPEANRAAFFDNPQRIENTISSMLMNKQLADEARAQNLEKDANVQSEVAQATNDALAAARLRKLRDEVKVPDVSQLAHEDYLAHKERYSAPPKVVVEHILISTTTRDAAAAKALAETVDKEARAKKTEFSALVQKYSDDAAKVTDKGMADGNDATTYGPAFAAATKMLSKPGDITVANTDNGIQIIRLASKTAGAARPYADVKDEIIARMRNDFIDKAVAGHRDELRNKPLDANADLVASLRTRYAKPAAK